MTPPRPLAWLLALAALAGCSHGGTFPGAGDDELPWPMEAQGCDKDSAPPAPDHYDPRAIATALTWVYRDHPVEAFCGCAFGQRGDVHNDACGYRDDVDPAPRVAWMPVVPPSRFGVYRACWRQYDEQAREDLSARRHCAKVDPEFRAMEADLYNYLPVIAALGERRADDPFGNVQGEPRAFGACDFELQGVMGKYSLVEPPENVRGDIARTYLYMAARYGKGKDWKIKLTREQRQMYQKWSAEDPVDDWERMRACRIQAIQGWANPYVK